jgi:hypothetical protein
MSAHLQGRSISQIRNQLEADNKQNVLAACFTLFSSLAYSSNLKIETIYSSETLVAF